MNHIVSRMAFCAALLAEGAAAAQAPDTLDARLAPAAGGGLTSDVVATRARETNFDAAAKTEALNAANARLDQARVAYYPKLTLTARYTRLSPVTQPVIAIPTSMGVGTGMSMMGSTAPFQFPAPLDLTVLQAGLDIPLTDYVLRISQNYAAASRNKRAAALDAQAARLKAALDGRQIYYSWLRAKAQLVVEERSLDQAKGHLEDARHSFDVGTASKADVLTTESQVASAELVLERAKNVVILTEEQLRLAMNDTSGQPYAIGENLGTDVPPLAPSENLAALRAEALDKRLEIRALDETAWSLRSQAKAARASYFPRIDAFGDLIYANPNQRIFPQEPVFNGTWDVGVQLVWTPNDALSAGGASSESEARAAQTEMQKAALKNSVRLEVTQAYQAVREAEIALQTTKRGLDAAEEGYRVRRELFRNGRSTSVELTDSQVQLIRASIESINARANLRSALAALSHATGRDVPAGMLVDSK
jgi:outer membrane protein TolC